MIPFRCGKAVIRGQEDAREAANLDARKGECGLFADSLRPAMRFFTRLIRAARVLDGMQTPQKTIASADMTCSIRLEAQFFCAVPTLSTPHHHSLSGSLLRTTRKDYEVGPESINMAISQHAREKLKHPSGAVHILDELEYSHPHGCLNLVCKSALSLTSGNELVVRRLPSEKLSLNTTSRFDETTEPSGKRSAFHS